MSTQTPDRYFVTGGAGFIGSHMVERLLNEGHHVTVYDNLSSSTEQWIKQFVGHHRFRFVRADLLDAESLTHAISGHHLVVHFAANSDIPGGIRDTRLDLDNGTIGTFNVLEAMRTAGVNDIIFSSSSTVYGDIDVRPTPEDAGPLLPISLYGAAKLACEGLISGYCHLFGLKARIFRFGNVVGARMGHGVIYDFIHKLRRNPLELEILGDGRQDKNYFLVEDCIGGMLHVWHQADETPCIVYNLGTEKTVLVSEIAEIVASEMKLSEVHFHYTGGERGWLGDVPKVIYDVSKVKAVGWEASHTSAEAVRIATRRLLQETLV